MNDGNEKRVRERKIKSAVYSGSVLLTYVHSSSFTRDFESTTIPSLSGGGKPLHFLVLQAHKITFLHSLFLAGYNK